MVGGESTPGKPKPTGRLGSRGSKIIPGLAISLQTNPRGADEGYGRRSALREEPTMDRKIIGAQPLLRRLFLTVSLIAGCATSPEEAAVSPVSAFEELRPVTLDALPSPAAAALLPGDARYRIALGPDGTLALLILGPDRRILGHMRIAAGAGPRESPGVRVEWEEKDGRTARVEAWSLASSLRGHAFVGERSAAWRVRHDSDGSLAGEGWSIPRRGPAAAAEAAELERARMLGAELGEFVTWLASSGAIEERLACELAERIVLARLALDLGKRAWTGHGRARLPTLGASEDPCSI
jgi:hypothetical protein